MDIKETVLAFFRSKGQIPGDNESEQLACRYLDVDLLDSMGVVEMVMELERIFGLSFTSEAMQSERFQTIGGLIGVVEELRSR